MRDEASAGTAYVAALTQALNALGSTDHIDRLVDFVGAMVLHDTVTVVRYSATERPEFVSWRNYSAVLVQKYLEHYYVFDPFYADWRENRRPGIVALRTMQGLTQGPYVADFLGESQLCDEVGILVEDGGDWCLGIFLDRRQHRYTKAEILRLQRGFPVFSALHALDIRLRAPGFRRTPQIASPGRIPGVVGRGPLADNLWPELTLREREIVQLIVSGHPTATIAQRLAISPGTAKNHRANIYRKLDITTERELFLRHIQTLS